MVERYPGGPGKNPDVSAPQIPPAHLHHRTWRGLRRRRHSANATCAKISPPCTAPWPPAWMCADFSTGRCWTILNGSSATPKNSACSPWISPMKNCRARRNRWPALFPDLPRQFRAGSNTLDHGSRRIRLLDLFLRFLQAIRTHAMRCMHVILGVQIFFHLQPFTRCHKPGGTSRTPG